MANAKTEAAAALAIAGRFIIHLTEEGLVTKRTTLDLLAECIRDLRAMSRPEASDLVRRLAEHIDQQVADDPNDGPPM